MTTTWIRATDEERLRKIKGLSDLPLSTIAENVPMGRIVLEGFKIQDIEDNILEGELTNQGLVNELRRNFVLAEYGLWVSETGNQRVSYATIRNHPMYPEGIILTPYSEQQVRFHLKKRTINQTTNFHRVELQYHSLTPFVPRTFMTYYYSTALIEIQKNTNAEHLLVYSTDKTNAIKRARTQEKEDLV